MSTHDYNTSNGSSNDWISDIDVASQQDPRDQPWKKTFGNTVDLIDAKEDILTVKLAKPKDQTLAA